MKPDEQKRKIFRSQDQFKFLTFSDQPKVMRNYKWDRSQFINFVEDSLKDISSSKMVFKTLSH